MNEHRVICSDCLGAMSWMPDASIDSIVTDPPYGLSFMGKAWDHGVPGVPFWAEALRIAKPGAYLVAFGGTRTYHRLACAIEDAGWEVRDCLSWLYGSGFPKNARLALKPAWEPAILARKPMAGTLDQNEARYRTGGINVDACRIGDEVRFNPPAVTCWTDQGFQARATEGKTVAGRWPANVLLDEEAAAALDAQTGTLHSGTMRANARKTEGLGRALGAGWKPEDSDRLVTIGDSGGASRFFYCAKASKSERGAGNTHPTVKPIALMRWIVRLVTPPGGIVLDPFAGSGTTGLAARAEGMSAILVEREPAYARIIAGRLEAA